MFNRFFHFILSSYENETLEIRKKTRMLLVINSLFILLVLLNLIIVEFIVSHDYFSALMEGSMVLILSISLVLLKMNKFLVSSNLTLVLMICAMSALGAIGTDPQLNFTLSKLGLYLLPIIIYSSLIGIRTYQTIMSSGLSLSVLTVIFLLAPFTRKDYQFNGNDISQFVTSFIILVAAGLMSYFTLKNNSDMVALAEKESKINRDKNERIEGVVQSSKQGMSIGEKLVEFAARTVELVTHINQNFDNIRKETDFLSAIIRSSQDSNPAMLDSSRKVKSIIGEQNAAVNETSSSVEEITRSMDHIATSATSRKEIIDRLVQTARESQKEMDQAVGSIHEISRSAEDMLHIIKVIQDVASQTNVLAMNAAIEASHAGASGKGFAIVATEIRKLSVETDRNSKLITATLKKNIGDIAKASAINVRAGEYFQKMSSEVTEVKNAMEEIIIGMQEVSKGTGSILEAVTDILKMSGDVGQSMNEVDTRITDSNGNIQNIATFTSELKAKIETMVKSYEDIIHITSLIDKAGKENTRNMEKLDNEITSIMK